MRVVPLPLDEANAFVLAHHRHHRPVVGHLFSFGAEAEGGGIVGVAICGRPIARMLHDGLTVEVTRVATDGTRNACSFLYGAAWRAARALGYRRLVTYTLASESGASLRAAGLTIVGQVAGGSWSRPSRPRVDKHPLQAKLHWQVNA